MMLPYIKIDTYLFVYMQFHFWFDQEIAPSFMLSSYVFSVLSITYLKLFCKMIYTIRFFFL